MTTEQAPASADLGEERQTPPVDTGSRAAEVASDRRSPFAFERLVKKTLFRYARIEFSVLVASFGAYLVMLAVLQAPFSDPLDVVGSSLLGGFAYTESGERLAFYSMVASAALFAAVAMRCSQRLSRAAIVDGVIFLMGLAALFVATAWLGVLITVSVFLLAGRLLAGARLDSPRLRVFALAAATMLPIAIDLANFGGAGRASTAAPMIFAAGMVGLAVCDAYALRLTERAFPGFSLIVAATILWTTQPSFPGTRWKALFLAACIVMPPSVNAAVWNSIRRTFSRGRVGKLRILAVVGCIELALDHFAHELKHMNVRQYFWPLVQTLGVGLACGLALDAGGWRRRLAPDAVEFRFIGPCIDFVKTIGKSLKALIEFVIATPLDRKRLAWLLAAVVLPAAIWQGWFAVGIAIVCAGIAWGEGWCRSTRIAAAWGSMGIALACWPSSAYCRVPVRERVDEFHDGQLLSAIWEVERGERVYVDVYPLRSAEFYSGWLFRSLFGRTLRAADLVLLVGTPLLAIGGFAAGYAWTRSPIWGLAFALAPINWSGFSHSPIRRGLVVFVAGLAIEIMRSRGSQRWLLCLPILGLISFFAGPDLAVPFLVSVAAAIGVGFAPRLGVYSLVKGLLLGAAAVALSIALWGAALWMMAGVEGVREYWMTFFDYAQKFTSFYGLPVGNRWFPPRIWSDYTVIGIALFVAGGAAVWPALPSHRRRMGVFLASIAATYMLRGLARSDDDHYLEGGAMMPTIWMVILFAAIRAAVQTVRSRSILTANAAACFLAAMVWWAPFRGSNPLLFVRGILQLPRHEDVLRQPSPWITQLVGPEGYLWAGDCGIVNIEQQVPNPTRHAIAFCIGTPREQRRAVRDLERRNVRAILHSFSNFDGFDGPLRYWIILGQVLRTFRPGEGSLLPYAAPYLMPAEPDWEGLDAIPSDFLGVHHYFRLPYVWGARRWPELAPRLKASRDLDGWTPVVAEGEPGFVYTASADVRPRDWNYLQFQFAVNGSPGGKSWTTVSLQFSPDTDFPDRHQITWECPVDGSRHRYVLPVGHDPAWTWRTRMRSFRLSCRHHELTMSAPAQVYEIDEVREPGGEP
ncbi:MAG: hypothetical protein ACT4QC_00165 [Planctomycetaceae bacterium]